ncbi:hypothetical protein A3A55_03615 [Candidatus Roizmanbacteria bacterium RIFCSPLOWO2_01_FULL_40_14]|uniref:Uncharacterized protein n=1 Tax=Candidatus Roizmanbacteria bacterium GW2011_GWC2_41_7 TaxID=1618487 RepID=A0A0G0ZDU8_9BACT|nr:MAG: hypothetical protein UU78_C0066G0004 [Candidatus Roizmanbacteria bacterium GW2011_GWC2_41_7]OGK50022.1 MAG: hypothetical protein A3A55_03615 [Candidatus Roizmanbacteria bacterium RIFCSPLOWO2_01_FULL_40_14]
MKTILFLNKISRFKTIDISILGNSDGISHIILVWRIIQWVFYFGLLLLGKKQVGIVFPHFDSLQTDNNCITVEVT